MTSPVESKKSGAALLEAVNTNQAERIAQLLFSMGENHALLIEALTSAAKLGYAEIVKMILTNAKNLDINAKNLGDQNALRVAVNENQVAVVRVLIADARITTKTLGSELSREFNIPFEIEVVLRNELEKRNVKKIAHENTTQKKQDKFNHPIYRELDKVLQKLLREGKISNCDDRGNKIFDFLVRDLKAVFQKKSIVISKAILPELTDYPDTTVIISLNILQRLILVFFQNENKVQSLRELFIGLLVIKKTPQKSPASLKSYTASNTTSAAKKEDEEKGMVITKQTLSADLFSFSVDMKQQLSVTSATRSVVAVKRGSVKPASWKRMEKNKRHQRREQIQQAKAVEAVGVVVAAAVVPRVARDMVVPTVMVPPIPQALDHKESPPSNSFVEDAQHCDLDLNLILRGSGVLKDEKENSGYFDYSRGFESGFKYGGFFTSHKKIEKKVMAQETNNDPLKEIWLKPAL